MKMIQKHKLLPFLIATFFGIGKIRFAPGTIGSILAFPIYILLLVIYTFSSRASYISSDATIFILSVNTVILLIGMWASDQYSQFENKEDPSEIIIDEIVGQIYTTTIIIFFFKYLPKEILDIFNMLGIENVMLVIFILSFILFRLFDIFKPWPINYFDQNIKGGLGIMLDDIIASIMSVFAFLAIMYFLVDVRTFF